MNIQIFRSIEDAPKATGLAVIIDVFRAFTVEAFIFANGAEKIIPVLDLEEAYALKRENPEYILIGERGGIKPEGFDYGNSPTEVSEVDFTGKIVVHSTSNGTRGLINAVNADEVLAGSFVTASAIVAYAKKNNIETISLLSTSPYPDMDNEDILLANYIRDILKNNIADELWIKNEMKKSPAHAFLLGEAGVPQSDIDLCAEFNKFDFVIKKMGSGKDLYLIKE